jgi:hypothetical protein
MRKLLGKWSLETLKRKYVDTINTDVEDRWNWFSRFSRDCYRFNGVELSGFNTRE